MSLMMEHLLTIMRDKRTGVVEFRRAADALAPLILAEAFAKLSMVKLPVKTPCGVARGVRISSEVVVIPILRSGLTLLPAALRLMPEASVGILGMKRDEKTAEAHRYYEHFPKRLPNRVMLLDHMIATGGSVMDALAELITRRGFRPENIHLCGTVAAPEGIARITKYIPMQNITIAAMDEKLNDKKYIVPGLGDFGDRYFGHNQPLSAEELARFLTGKHRALIPGILKATRMMRKDGVSEEVKEALTRAAREVYERGGGIVIKAATLEGPFRK